MLSRLRDFHQRIRYFILVHEITVVRIHTGDDVDDARYARKWLRIISQLSGVRSFFYRRSWRVDTIRAVLETLS